MNKRGVTSVGSVCLTLLSLLAIVLLSKSVSELSWSDFSDSWSYWRQTLVLGSLAGLTLGLTGSWMVAQRSIYSALALSSATVMGTLIMMGLASFYGVSGMVFTESGGLILSLGIFMALKRFLRGRFQNDAIIAVIYLMSTAGLILVSDHIAHGHHEIESHLFGNSISISSESFGIFLPAFVLLAIVAVPFYRSWRDLSFDPVFSRIRDGRSFHRHELALSLFMFLSLMFAARNFGILVTFSLFLFAPLTALHQSKSHLTALILSGLYGSLLFPAGFLVSFFLDWPTGACISILGFAVFFAMQFYEITYNYLKHEIALR